jgi:hypothetical protein
LQAISVVSRASLQDWLQNLLPFTALQEHAGWAHLLFSSMTHLVLGWMHRDCRGKAQGCAADAIYPQCDHSHLTPASNTEDISCSEVDRSKRRGRGSLSRGNASAYPSCAKAIVGKRCELACLSSGPLFWDRDTSHQTQHAGVFGAEGRARIAAAQKKRWAKQRKTA